MNSDSVDLIYLDPPFNSDKEWNAPIGSEAAGAHFKDTWSLSDVDKIWHDLLRRDRPVLHDIILAAWQAADNKMMAYLIYMAVRLIEMERVLKPEGTLYLHCDQHASHYLKMLLDAIFGKERFRSEIIWKRHGGRSDAAAWGKITDSIFMYAPKGTRTLPEYTEREKPPDNVSEDGRGEYTKVALTGAGTRDGDSGSVWRGYDPTQKGRHWAVPKPGVGTYGDWLDENLPGYGEIKGALERLDFLEGEGFIYWAKTGTPSLKRYLAADKGIRVNNLWTDIAKASGKERTNYPTQKPLALLERIIKASSSPGDVVLDPFCGCATAPIAAEKLQREWVGVDLSAKADDLVRTRLAKELGLASSVAIHRTDQPLRTDLGKLPPYREHRNALYGEQEGHCAGCGDHFEIRHFHVDHIVAETKGGTDHKDNLQLLCGNCNSRKGNGEMSALVAKLIEDRTGQYR